MFLSKENIIMEPNNKYIQVGNLFDESETSLIDICALKTTLLPTIKLSYESKILCPRVFKRDDKNFLKNVYISVKEILETEYIYIPKIQTKTEETVSKTVMWLYGKYIASGYIKNSSQVIIPVKRISQKEEKQVLNLDSTFTIKSTDDINKKIIISSNQEIIRLFSNFTKLKTLKDFALNSNQQLFKIFIRSLFCEKDDNNRVKLENQILAHEIFINAYAKCDKILKITEERIGSNKKKSKNKKQYYISQSDELDYEIICNNLYTRVIQNRIGKNTVGIDISEHELYEDDGLICNSIVLENKNKHEK